MESKCLGDKEHDYKWFSATNGSGYWQCRRPGCSEIIFDDTDHNGG